MERQVNYQHIPVEQVKAALRKHRKKTSTRPEILHQAEIFRSFQKRFDAIDRKLGAILRSLRGRGSRDR
jgi:hypothetical protein